MKDALVIHRRLVAGGLSADQARTLLRLLAEAEAGRFDRRTVAEEIAGRLRPGPDRSRDSRAAPGDRPTGRQSLVTATAILDLERAGFTREQVEALARWHEAGIDLSHLATKADLADLKAADLGRDSRGQGRHLKWMVGVGFVQTGDLIGAAFAMLKLFPGGHP